MAEVTLMAKEVLELAPRSLVGEVELVEAAGSTQSLAECSVAFSTRVQDVPLEWKRAAGLFFGETTGDFEEVA